MRYLAILIPLVHLILGGEAVIAIVIVIAVSETAIVIVFQMYLNWGLARVQGLCIDAVAER
jgi:hypothetical protein